MSDTLTLAAETRDRVGKGASRALRREGRVPAVIYGQNQEPQGIHLEEKALVKALGTGHFFNSVIMVEGAGGRAYCSGGDIRAARELAAAGDAAGIRRYFEAEYGLDRIIAQRNKGTAMGFGATVKENDDRGVGEVFKDLEPEDLLKFGLIPEFVGRLPVIATLTDLDEEALIAILTKPKNALVKQYQRLFEMEGTKLSFTEDALRSVAGRAIQRKTGARGLRSIMEAILLATMFDLPGLEDVDEVVINREVAEGRASPLYIYGERPAEQNSA